MVLATSVTVPAHQPLLPGAKRRGLATILVDTFLVWGGFFMVVPLISVHYVDQLGWAAASIGLVLAIRQLVQQGLTPLSGVLADRIGPKYLICAGLLVRSVGFASMAWAHTFPLLLLSAVLAALGGSLFESPKSAAIAALTDDASRNRFYALSGVVSGLGVTLGTQIGALLLAADFALVALIAAACFLIDFVVTLIFLPAVRVAADGNGLTRGIGMALHDRRFMTFNVLLMGFWFLWVQFSISLPLAAKAIGGTNNSVALIYAINSGMNLLLGYPVLRLADRWLRPLPLFNVGMVLMALGFGGIAFVSNLPMLLLCVVAISAGVLLAMPSQQTIAANFADPAALGSYFGINALAMAFGGGLGNLSGGVFYDLGKHNGFAALPWVVFCAVGLLATSGLVVLARQQRRTAAPEASLTSHHAG